MLNTTNSTMNKSSKGRYRYSLLALSFFVCSIPNIAFAVTPTVAGTITRQLEQAEEFREQKEGSKRETESLGLNAEELSTGAAKPLNSSVKFELQAIEIAESEIFTDEEVERITQGYLRRVITLNDLNKLLSEINALYKLKGYLASKAYLPPQKISNGTVQINLIEGRIDAINVEGNETTNKAYILDHLDIAVDDLVELKQLEKRLERINLLSDIQLGIALKPSEVKGKTNYLLTAKEPKRRESFVYTDNAGTKDVGLYRFGFNYIDRSLTGRRDSLTLGAYGAEGTEAFYSSYEFPVNSLGTQIKLSGNVSRIEIIDGAVEVLEITGDSYSVGAELSHPLLVTRANVVTAKVAVNKKKSSTDVAKTTLFETVVKTFDVGLNWQSFSESSISYASIKGTFGPGEWGNETSFFKVNADYSYNTALQEGWLAQIRFGGQWSDTELLPSVEQFQVGGVYTVRGYVEGLLIGDQGYYSSAELSHEMPNNMKSLFGNNARYFLFLDHGGAFPYKGNGEGIDSDDFLTSIGIGVDFSIYDVATAHISVGKPVMRREDDEDGGRINFTLQAAF